MPLPYTGRNGELNFEADFISLLQKAGWGEVLKNKTKAELEQNWRDIIFDRNLKTLNNVPLSDLEMEQVMEQVRTKANTPVKANHFINGSDIAITRDSDSADIVHRGKPVYLDIFSAREIAGGSSRYQIAEQTYFETSANKQDRRGDITLLINGMPVIHIELKASGVPVDEATTQIQKYAHSNIWTGIYSLVQVFFAISPEDAVYFANPGKYTNYNPEFFFRWGDRDNNRIVDWKELICSSNSILSIPEAHKLIGYYTVADANKDVLKVCRSYQYTAIKAIVSRTAKQKWGDHDQLGGFVWCTTGGGKTMTSFKAGQLIIDMHHADKVVFVVDRQALDAQSLEEYNSFSRPGESVVGTNSRNDLFTKLLSTKSTDHLIMTTIQKLSRIATEDMGNKKNDLNKILQKRIVFIIDEAHRSQFGTMHQAVKNMFVNALFFGFTGTPIFAENLKAGEMTTETVFGKVLSVYSLANGIKDGNVLGFWPTEVHTYADEVLKERVALAECNANSVDEIKNADKKTQQRFRDLTVNTPMASKYYPDGTLKIKGIEDYLPPSQYNNDGHRTKVVDAILDRFAIESVSGNGTRFSALLATDSISEAVEYYHLFKDRQKLLDQDDEHLHVTIVFDPHTNENNSNAIMKTEAVEELLEDYNNMFGTKFDRKTDPDLKLFKKDVMNRLAHKKPYNNLKNNHDLLLDIVIVVDQLLTGFDSQYLNTLHLDKVLESDNLIQAISRTNRVLNDTEKPWGMVKFYRKPYTMRRNLNDALEMYCLGEKTGVEVAGLDENVEKIHQIFVEIVSIFNTNNIDNFGWLPKPEPDRQKFRKLFLNLKTTIRAAIMQGFKWSNEWGAKVLPLDYPTYKLLQRRYDDLPSGRSGGGGLRKPGYAMGNILSMMEGDKIDIDFIESRFGEIISITQIEAVEERLELQAKLIADIRSNLGTLPESLQKWAKLVLSDIESGALIPEKGKTFSEYIAEYSEQNRNKALKEEADKFGLDYRKLLNVYVSTIDAKNIDEYGRLTDLESSADSAKVNAYFGCSSFKARAMLHNHLTDYILQKKADE